MVLDTAEQYENQNFVSRVILHSLLSRVLGRRRGHHEWGPNQQLIAWASRAQFLKRKPAHVQEAQESNLKADTSVMQLKDANPSVADTKSQGLSPFVKWAGGKSQLLGELRRYFPTGYNRYFEPFLGGGAVYFFLRPKQAVISDANFELINTYRVVAGRVEELIRKLSRLQNRNLTEKLYYQIRDQNPKRLAPVSRAVRLIFLNKTCYNGLYRVNRDGKFNVPFGKYDKMPKLFDAANLREASGLLKSATITPGYCNVVLREFHAGEGDFVYLDPPYAVENGNGFTSYTKELFSWHEQERLAKEFASLAEKGCYVMLSNADTEGLRDLYADVARTIIPVKADRMISSNGKRRTGFSELIILSYVPKVQTLQAWIGEQG